MVAAPTTIDANVEQPALLPAGRSDLTVAAALTVQHVNQEH